MLSTLTLALSLALPQQAVDTVIQLRGESRLEVTNARGSIRVGTWDRPGIRVRATVGARDALDIVRSGQVLRIVAVSHRGTSAPVVSDTSRVRITTRSSGKPVPAIDYEITVPVTLDVTAGGLMTSVTVDSVRGTIDVGNTSGTVLARGGGGSLHVESLAGSVEIAGFQGAVFVRAMRGAITVHGTVGDVQLSSVMGAITIADARAVLLTASTYSGTVSFTGGVPPRARYELSTQTGPMLLHLAPDVGATVDVAAAPSRLALCKPLSVSFGPSPSLRRVLIRDGSAALRLDSFSGHIELCNDAATNPAIRRGNDL